MLDDQRYSVGECRTFWGEYSLVPRPTLLFDLCSALAIMHGSRRAVKAVKIIIPSSLDGLSCWAAYSWSHYCWSSGSLVLSLVPINTFFLPLSTKSIRNWTVQYVILHVPDFQTGQKSSSTSSTVSIAGLTHAHPITVYMYTCTIL